MENLLNFIMNMKIHQSFVKVYKLMKLEEIIMC